MVIKSNIFSGTISRKEILSYLYPEVNIPYCDIVEIKEL